MLVKRRATANRCVCVCSVFAPLTIIFVTVFVTCMRAFQSPTVTFKAVFITGIFYGGIPPPPKKKLTIPSNGCHIAKQSKGCKFMPKMHQNMFGGRALPRPAIGELNMRSPIRTGCNGGLRVSGMKGRRDGTGGESPQSQSELNKHCI